jgi:iron complex outermembrane receptor protein
MNLQLKPLFAAMITLHAAHSFAQATAQEPQMAQADAPVKKLGVVVVSGNQPTSLPTQIPTTTEGITKQQIEQTINATDSEDALKYFPSLLVRKRYIGDYNHAILSTRASGTGNSARSLVFADGIQLSNLLGNGVGGLSFTPRWGLVTPEEIERVDVMYGPFSAAYSGNSVGAVVDYVTRMPTKFEAHVATGYTLQSFNLFSTDSNFRAWNASASIGNKSGDFSYWINYNHADSSGQPLTFATRLRSAGTTSTAGTAVTGAILDSNNANAPWFVLGTGTQYDTKQDHVKAKLAYDFSPTTRATYTFGVWQNSSDGNPVSYLRDASGAPVYSGPINIGGLAYTGSSALSGGDFVKNHQDITHYIHGLTVKTNSKGTWDWEVAASLYDYDKDLLRANSAANPLPNAANGGAGTITDGNGTGWNTLAARATWRPFGPAGAHIVEGGAQQDSYKLRYRVSAIAGNWMSDAPGSLTSNVRGDTQLSSLWAQDTWSFAPDWKAVLGVRAESWKASNGLTSFSAASSLTYADRKENFLSPKGAVSFQLAPDTVLKASLGRAVRFPTVAELYGATSTTNSQYINDPNLRPEKSWTGELSAEKDFGNGVLRATLFAENVRDSLYSQTILDPIANKNISRVQNIGRIATSGVEIAYSGNNVIVRGLDLSGSVTYADSIIKENAGFVVTPGDTIGKWQPNIPKWRATGLASYRVNEQLSTTLGVRYSGPQFRTLNNSDVNGFTYQGVSKFITADVRVVWKVTKQVTAAFGIDNVNNYKFWNFHPYPQRSYQASLKADF